MSEFSHGFFQSVDIENLDDTFLYYNKEKLLTLLENSPNKINEKVTQDIHEKNKKGLLYKDVKQFQGFLIIGITIVSAKLVCDFIENPLFLNSLCKNGCFHT